MTEDGPSRGSSLLLLVAAALVAGGCAAERPTPGREGPDSASAAGSATAARAHPYAAMDRVWLEEER